MQLRVCWGVYGTNVEIEQPVTLGRSSLSLLLLFCVCLRTRVFRLRFVRWDLLFYVTLTFRMLLICCQRNLSQLSPIGSKFAVSKVSCSSICSRISDNDILDANPNPTLILTRTLTLILTLTLTLTLTLAVSQP